MNNENLQEMNQKEIEQNHIEVQSENDELEENEDNQYVIFKIEGQDYGIEIEYVHEIDRLKEVVICPVPKAPEYVEGIINLRGEVVPVIDLRKKLGLPEREAGRETRILIVKMENKTIGLLVDMVLKVLNIDEKYINGTPEEIKDVNTRFFSGIVQMDEMLIFLVNIKEILGSEEE